MARRGTRARRLAAAVSLAVASSFLVGSVGLSTNMDSRLLAAHNRERSALGIAPLAWDTDLAANAEEWAGHLAELNDLEHFTDDVDEGENLWLGPRRDFSPEAMVGLWVEEKKNFVPGVFPDNSRTGVLDDVGHYTQLMWRDTRRVGCAVSDNGEHEILVCRYARAGNVIGEVPF